MINPFAKLKQAILDKDWKGVCEAYMYFTGEGLTLLDKAEESVEDQQTGDDYVANEPEPEPEPEEQEIGHRGACKKIPFRKKSGPNRFVDDCTIDNKLIKDSKYDSTHIKQSHGRPAVKKIMTVCTVCGLKEMVDPIFAVRLDKDDNPIAYKCNPCIVKAKPNE